MNDTPSDNCLPEHLAEAVRRRLRERQRLPVNTYRLQLHGGFTFQDARAIVPYLAKLGITDCYCSPYLRARPGSMHGYDICAHNELNPELGSEADFEAFVAELKAHGLGQILDFVPNHMAADPELNPWWRDVLENGRASLYSRFFDIDWHPVKPELNGKVLLPVLGDHYGLVLERGELQLAFDKGTLTLGYHDHHLPIDPGQYSRVLRFELTSLQADLKEADPNLVEFLSILTVLDHLPGVGEIDPERTAERRREKKLAQDRLAQVAAASPRIREHIENALRTINGQPGQPHSFDRLHELLEAQPYRLANWRTAFDEINYRRFFDIKELVGLRMEEPALFADAHELIFRLIRERKLTGLRLDHLDGLFDPAGYLDALQEAVVYEWTADLAPPGMAPETWRRQVQVWRTGEQQQDRATIAARPLFIAVEKILTGNESLPRSWPIHGTSGYVFLNDVNRLFINPDNTRTITRVYERFTGMDQPFADVVYECKKLITWTALASELNVLAHALNRLSEGNRRARDFTLNYLREALRETVACFPVYRTYVSAAGATDADRQVIDMTLARARQRNPAMESLVFGFLRQVLLPGSKIDDRGSKIEDRKSMIAEPGILPSSILHSRSSMSEDEYRQRLEFAMKFQQYTGPVQAKGMEDTAFYRFNRLVSLNEVGGDPQRFGGFPEQFHQANRIRLAHWPYAMLATATHDTKRGEDSRARLNVLSEIPADWRRMVFQWSRINSGNRTVDQGEHRPHRNDEYLFYQALLGAWPAVDQAKIEDRKSKIEKDSVSVDSRSSILHPPSSAPAELIERLREYMLKAIHEAKVHTSWINPNDVYDQAVADFVTKTLTGRRGAKFLASFLPFQQRVARLGMVNSLAQVVLKMISPGVPDFYQGTELWDFSLVDPDNRRPVDFAHRGRMLESLEPFLQDNETNVVARFSKSPAATTHHSPLTYSPLSVQLTEMLDHWQDGRIKLLITACGLRLRRQWPDVFAQGAYLPLEATGEMANHVVAVARHHQGFVILAIVPRLVAGLARASAEWKGRTDFQSVSQWLPIGADTWRATRLILPASLWDPISAAPRTSFRNVFTGESVPIAASRDHPLAQGGKGDGGEGATSLFLANALSKCPVALLEGRTP